MAQPTEEELETELQSQFEAYMVEVKRLLKGSTTAVRHAISSARINGYSLADLIAIIAGEVKTHEDNPNNPHAETLAQLNGMDSVTFETKAGNFFPKDAMPISQIPSLQISVAGAILTIEANTMFYMGRKISLSRTISGAMSPVNQYLKVTITGKQPNRAYAYSLISDDSEAVNKFIVAVIKYSGGVWTVTPVPCVRIGAARLSPVPHGQSIPVSSGTQAGPGTINPGWIG